MPQKLRKPCDQRSVTAKVQSPALRTAYEPSRSQEKRDKVFPFSKESSSALYVGKEHAVEAAIVVTYLMAGFLYKTHLQAFSGKASC